MTSTLYRHGVVHSAQDPFAEALLVVDGVIAWLGADDTAAGMTADEVVDLDGALVTPGFVDAHAHLLPTGRALARRAGEPADTTDAVDAVRDTLVRRALGAAAAAGIVSVHDHSSPAVETRSGLAGTLARTADPSTGLAHVVGYRSELCATPEDAARLRAAVPGLTGVGGDPFGTPTTDADVAAPAGLSAEQVARHVGAAASAGLQAVLQVLPGAGLQPVLDGLRAVAARDGLRAVHRARVRLEGVTSVSPSDLAALVPLGVRLSVQPTSDGSVAPFADIAAAGVPVALGSAAPVHRFDPWVQVRAAVWHPDVRQRVSARSAFRAATRAGWRLAGDDTAGELRTGAPAHLAVWRAERLGVQGTGRSVWSTDARAGTPLLPDLSPDAPAPRCLRTVRAGVVLYDALGRPGPRSIDTYRPMPGR